MKNHLLFITFLFISFAAEAEKLQLSKVETREKYSFIQLQHGTGEGKQFSEILSDVTIEKDTVAIRLLGDFSQKANSQLLAYYENNVSAELKIALSSSGNLHNPALYPLIRSFSEAFKTTQLFQEINSEMVKLGYMATKIEFEKYSIDTSGAPQIWVADIWLQFE